MANLLCGSLIATVLHWHPHQQQRTTQVFFFPVQKPPSLQKEKLLTEVGMGSCCINTVLVMGAKFKDRFLELIQNLKANLGFTIEFGAVGKEKAWKDEGKEGTRE